MKLSSLLEDLKGWFEEEQTPPDSAALDNVNYIARDVLDERRWYNRVRHIYKREDVYVAVEVDEPATELQDWGDGHPPEVYRVKPVAVQTFEYQRLDTPVSA